MPHPHPRGRNLNPRDPTRALTAPAPDPSSAGREANFVAATSLLPARAERASARTLSRGLDLLCSFSPSIYLLRPCAACSPYPAFHLSLFSPGAMRRTGMPLHPATWAVCSDAPSPPSEKRGLGISAQDPRVRGGRRFSLGNGGAASRLLSFAFLRQSTRTVGGASPDGGARLSSWVDSCALCPFVQGR